MPRLNKLVFNIRSIIRFPNRSNLLSHEDIQDTFRDFKDNEIISCVNYFPEMKKGQCHVYSYSYATRYYYNVTNNFSGELFICVRNVSLYDEHPFEHESFRRIARSFPLLEELTLMNWKGQRNERCQKLNENNQDLSVIEYPHLNNLILYEVHDDYVEQFLVDTNMCLPNGIYLHLHYQSLKNVTHDFKKDSTRINCCKVEQLYIFGESNIPQLLKDYFPLTKI